MALSFLALFSWPYAYYQILKILVFCVVIYYFYMGNKNHKHLPAPLVALALAILFNPIAPIYLSRSTWSFLNIICGVYFLVVSNFLKHGTSHAN